MCRIEEQKNSYRSETKNWSELFRFSVSIDLKIKHQAVRSTLCRRVEKTKSYFLGLIQNWYEQFRFSV